MSQVSQIERENAETLLKLKQRSKLTDTKVKAETIESLKIMRLGIVTKNDMVGLCEITDKLPARLNTVTCFSESGSAYFMTRE